MQKKKTFGIALIVIFIFTLVVFFISNFLLPILPEGMNSTLQVIVLSLLGVLAVLANMNNVVELIGKILGRREEKIHQTDLTKIDGSHHARGSGDVTAIDAQGPVIFGPGTKSTAEGRGKITATRISSKKGDDP